MYIKVKRVIDFILALIGMPFLGIILFVLSWKTGDRFFTWRIVLGDLVNHLRCTNCAV